MERCSRCGCFFIGNTDICANCMPMETSDKAKLDNYCENNAIVTYDSILYGTGIASSNLSRYLQLPDYSELAKKINKGGN